MENDLTTLNINKIKIMCGILIYKAPTISSEIEKNFANALADLKSRGPDETRFLKNKNFLIGFTRLSINNINDASQPFKSICGRYLIVFNGEIVNYRELYSKIYEKKIEMKFGHEAEVIISLYKIYGNKCINLLKGFFAFVIIDLTNENIFSAVDRFSIKPLYYVNDPKKNLSIFTSDYSVLIKNNLIKSDLNVSKIIDYLSLARDFNNSTIYSKIKKLPASTYLEIKKNITISKKYWHPFKNKVYLNQKLAFDELSKKIQDTIDLWKISETPISLCASLGVDSQILNNFFKENDTDVNLFHIPEGKNIFFNYHKARKISLNQNKIIKLLNKFTKKTYNPFPLAHSSSTSLFQLYDHIKENKFKVTFNGEGSDELFGGYSRYSKQLKFMKQKNKFSDMLISTYKNEIDNIKKYFYKEYSYDLSKQISKRIDSINLKSKNIENKILEFDQITFIPVMIQRHDSIGMFNSLEVRPPFLEHDLVDTINSMPTNLKFKFNESKIVLKRILLEKFNYKPPKTKLSTPNIFNKILENKQEINNFKESIFYGKLGSFLNSNQIIKQISNVQKKNEIFLWRIYILSKILYKY